MNEDLVSVVIPAYNAEKYILECIHSILNQSYVNFEIVIVDDGSMDSTATICQKIAQEDTRIKYFYQQNAGVTNARKKGVKLASGKYISFIDADDTIQRDFLKILVDKISEGYELVISESGTKGMIDGKEYVAGMLEGRYPPSIWGKLIRRDVLTEHVFDISREMFVGEDVIMNILLGLQVKKIYVLTVSLYNYEIHDTSVMCSRKVSLAYDEKYIQIIRKCLGNRYPEFEQSFLRLQLHTLENLIVCKVKIPYRKEWIYATLKNASRLKLSDREWMVVWIRNSFVCRYALALERRLRLYGLKKINQ